MYGIALSFHRGIRSGADLNVGKSGGLLLLLRTTMRTKGQQSEYEQLTMADAATGIDGLPRGEGEDEEISISASS